MPMKALLPLQRVELEGGLLIATSLACHLPSLTHSSENVHARAQARQSPSPPSTQHEHQCPAHCNTARFHRRKPSSRVPLFSPLAAQDLYLERRLLTQAFLSKTVNTDMRTGQGDAAYLEAGPRRGITEEGGGGRGGARCAGAGRGKGEHSPPVYVGAA